MRFCLLGPILIKVFSRFFRLFEVGQKSPKARRNILLQQVVLLLLFSHTPLFSQENEEILPSSSEQIAERSFTTDTLVSPLTGQLTLAETDLIAKGAKDVILRRIYIPPHVPSPMDDNSVWEDYLFTNHIRKHYQGWKFLPQLAAYFFIEHDTVRLTDANGITLDFFVKDSKTTILSPTFGMSNVSGDQPGGEYDLRNTQITFIDDKKKMIVRAPDGTLRHYRYLVKTFNKAAYFLEKEILPSGKLLSYHYTNGKLSRIASMDLKEEHVYAYIDLNYQDSQINFTASTGQTAFYQCERRKVEFNVKDKHKRLKGTRMLPPLLTQVSSPFWRGEGMQYSSKHLLEVMLGKEHIFHSSYKEFKGDKIPSHLRVSQLQLPIGADDAFQPMYAFDYDLPRAGKKGGVTRVKSFDGRETLYHFSQDLFLERVEHKNKKGELEKEKIYHFKEGPSHWLDWIAITDREKMCL